MHRRASKTRRKKEDSSQAAHRVLQSVIERSERVIDPAVSAAAAALSKLGASKGGKARAKKLTAKRRSKIARDAAAARWSKKEKRG